MTAPSELLRRTLEPLDRRVGGAYAVFERDFLYLTSRKRFIALRWLVGALMALVAIVIVVNIPEYRMDSAGVLLHASAHTAATWMVILVTPAITATAIVGERSAETLTLVLAAPVRPFGFVFAKVVSRLATVLVLYFATLPIVALSLLYGGVAASRLSDTFEIGVACAVWGAAAGVLASAFCKRVSSAILLAYLLGLLVPLVQVCVTWPLFEWLMPNGYTPRDVFGAIAATPMGAWWVSSMSTWTSGFGGGGLLPNVRATGMTAALVFAAVTVPLATWRMAREGRFAAGAARRGRARRELLTLNPVLGRSLWRCALVRPVPSNLVLCLVVCVIDALILGIAYGTDSLDEYFPHTFALIAITSLTGFAMLGWAGQSITSERQHGALDLALATPLGATGVLRGKLAGLLCRAAPPLLIGLVHGLAAATWSDLKLASVVAWGVTSVIQILFIATFALLVTCRARTVQAGVVRTFGLFFGAITVHLIVGALMVAVTSGDADKLYELWFFASPTLTVSFPTTVLSDTYLSSSEQRILVICGLWNFLYAMISVGGVLALPGILRGEAE